MGKAKIEFVQSSDLLEAKELVSCRNGKNGWVTNRIVEPTYSKHFHNTTQKVQAMIISIPERQ